MKPETPNKMKTARFFANITQRRLEQMSGVDQSTICLIENGYKNPNAEQKQKLAKALKTKVEWLFPKKC